MVQIAPLNSPSLLEFHTELYRLYHGHPGLELRWIKAHNGTRWNEYADSLATAYRRE